MVVGIGGSVVGSESGKVIVCCAWWAMMGGFCRAMLLSLPDMEAVEYF